MPLRKRFKRLQAKVKGVSQALKAPGGFATSTTSLPNVLITSADTNDPNRSYIEGIRTSAPTPDPPCRTRSPSPGISAVSPPESNPDNDATQAITILPHAPAILPSIIHASSSQAIGNGASGQSPSSTLSVHQTSPSGGLRPKQAFVTQDDPSRTIIHPETLSTSDPNTDPAPDATSKNENAPTQVPPTQPNHEAAPCDTRSITESMIAIHESNPVSEPSTTVPRNAQTPTWKCLNRFRQGLRGVSGMFGPLGPVIDGLSDCIGIYEGAMQSRQDYETLKSELESLFSVLSEHFSGHVPPTMTAAMKNLCTSIEAELDRISTKESRGRFQLYQEADKDIDDIIQCYRRIQAHLERLKLNADLSMWKTMDELATGTRLNTLIIGSMLAACYDSAEARELGRRECTPKTRKQVLQDLSYWRHDQQAGNIFWLNGMAGTGKTTIASSLCAMLDKSHELGASFFCSRLLPHCRDIKLILPAIAYQLACYSYPFRNALSLALQQEPNLYSKSLPKQLEGLIIKPLRTVVHTLPADLIVVVDALDECKDSEGVSLFLEILVESALDLPIKVFASSRPEPQIRQKIGDTKSQLILHELEHSTVREDIKLYLRTELMVLVPSISEVDLATLADRAGVLFIYAATVVRFVSSASVPLRQKRLQDVLEIHGSGRPSQNKAIDMLYDTILVSAFRSSDLPDNEKTAMKLVLDTVICAQEPLTIAAMAELLGLGDHTLVQAALEPFWSVLHIAGGDASGTVTTLHASFPEYMLDPTRSNEHACSAKKRHDQLASLCFNRIKNNKPQFNICWLESSFVPDDHVPNLKERVTRAIPQELMYSCLYWVSHLELAKPSEGSLKQLCELLSERLLLWVEILNLRKRARVAISILSKAEVWCRANNAPRVVETLVHDAWRFVTVFATSSACSSTPHLYTSMLASWERTGLLADSYVHRAKGLVRIEGSGLASRQFALLNRFFASEGGVPHSERVSSIAFSLTGTHIAFGSRGGMIHVCDAVTRRPTMDPIEGHTRPVNSVAFSSDGTRIVSGSSDQTIRVWDVKSGTSIMDPLNDDAGAVNVVAFSPNGRCIVSGSAHMIRVWDAASGVPRTAPTVAHDGHIAAVAFSPDGTCIVSGSTYGAIRLWSITPSGPPVGPRLAGHMGCVNSVAFSPDGRYVVSGSSDKTICMWDMTSRTLALGPIEGHTDRVNSVTFSPDGMHIVSGAEDGVVCVWDAASGKKPICTFRVQTASPVGSVAFSPDGGFLASGSSSRAPTICVWDPTKCEGSLETSRWLDSPPRFLTIFRTLSAVGHKAILMFLYSPTSPSQMPELIGECTTPVTSLSPPRMRHRLWWRLTKDVLGVLPNAETYRDLAIGASLYTHLLPVLFVHGAPCGSRGALYIYHLCTSPPGFLRVYTKGGSHSWRRVLSGLGVKFPVQLAGAKPPLTRAIGELCVPILLVCMGAARELLISAFAHIDTQLKNMEMWVQGTGRIAEFAQIPRTCFRLLAFLFGIIYSPGCVGGSIGIIIFLFHLQLQLLPVGMLSDRTEFLSVSASSPDGTRIAAGYKEGYIYILDTINRRLDIGPLEGHTNSIQSIAFSPDATRVVSGSRDRTIRVWDTTSGRSVMDPITGHTGSVDSVAFSSDDTRIVSGSGDLTIRVWDATSGMPVMDPITGHTGSVNSVVFSPDGTRIVSSSFDMTIRVWDATNGSQIMQLCTQNIPQIRSVAFLSDGARIATFSNEGTVRLWDTRMPKVKHNLWTLNEEGWVVDREGHLLLWLPTDLRPHLLPSRNLYSIPARRFITLNFDGANIGGAECYECA